jgi:AraC family transcriptional regulator of adaptative response/methylated-DNA-[protein]-cysteine methyltransferase
MNTLHSPSVSDDILWQAVLDRDAARDGTFVYAVCSTGVFCRPSCPSRRAKRAQVRFFATPAEAIAAGFRPCKRCRPQRAEAEAGPRLGTVGRVCRAIEERDEGRPTLTELGAAVAVSPHHLQRVFKATTGVSPMQYAEAVRLGRLKRSLREGEPVAEALYGAGYGSSSRLYEKAPAHLGMTPASYAKGGRGARIAFTVTDTPLAEALGRLLIAATERGICMVALGDSDANLEVDLRREYPLATVRRDDAALGAWVRGVLGLIDGNRPHHDLPLDIRATAFQWQVWTRLQAIPRGETLSYAAIAADLGQPKAARAVGRACAGNPVSLVVPCHRAVATDGQMRGYRWGIERKRALLERERRETDGQGS